MLVLTRLEHQCACEHTGQRSSAGRGRVTVGPSEFYTIERLDGFMRAPCGRYRVELARMRSSEARAIRLLPDGHREADHLPGFWRSLTAGRIYIHPANEPCQVQGCIAPGLYLTEFGVSRSVDAMVCIFAALGGWSEPGDDAPRRWDLRIVDDSAGG